MPPDIHVSSVITEAVVSADPTNTDYFAIRRSTRINNINDTVPETYLKDTRDGNYYRIRKLADGECWMTENLRLVFSNDEDSNSEGIRIGTIASDGVTITHNGNYITPENTNITAEQIEAWKPLVAKTEVSGALGTAHTVWGATDADTVKHPTTTSTDFDPEDGATKRRAAAFARSYYSNLKADTCNSGLNNPTLGADISGSESCYIGDGDMQDAGVFYNYTTAVAGEGKDIEDEELITTNSICPSNWQLPLAFLADEKSLGRLLYTYADGPYDPQTKRGVVAGNIRPGAASTYNAGYYHLWAFSATVRLAPLSIPFTGFYRYEKGSVGYVYYAIDLLSAHAYKYSRSIEASLRSGSFVPNTYGNKGYGLSIRCIAQ